VSKIRYSNLGSEIVQAIGDCRIQAALFCTYTFRRSFFETEVLDGILCGHGQLKGHFLVTVIVDGDNFHGQGAGYDVCKYPGTNLWHPKVIALMLRNKDSKLYKTALFIGSGNLTPSGWEKNLEVFSYFEWDGWVLPDAIERWAFPLGSIGSSTKFGAWYSKKHFGNVPPRINDQIIASSETASIWEQWNWSGSWTRAHVIAPFTDQAEDEANQEDEGYFSHLVEHSYSKTASLNIYLQGAPDGRVFGSWSTFAGLKDRVHIKVFRVGGENSRPLHAKLQAVYTEGTWQMLGGSPNATTAAMLRKWTQSGNVELAWQLKYTSPSLPMDFLPKAKEVSFKECNFIKPQAKPRIKRWISLESIRYEPSAQRLIPKWIVPHNIEDTVVSLAGTEVNPAQGINLSDPKFGSERAVATLPRNPIVEIGFEADWVPIECPFDVCDDSTLEKKWSFDQYLALLSGKRDFENTDSELSRAQTTDLFKSSTSDSTFPWHERMVALREALTNLAAMIEDADSELELNYVQAILKGCISSASDVAGLSPTEIYWREWSKFEIAKFILSRDKRKKAWRAMIRIVKPIKKDISPVLRKQLP
jgi:hypothetical protein